MRKSGRRAKDTWQFFELMNRKVVKWSLEVFGALVKSFCDEGFFNQKGRRKEFHQMPLYITP